MCISTVFSCRRNQYLIWKTRWIISAAITQITAENFSCAKYSVRICQKLPSKMGKFVYFIIIHLKIELYCELREIKLWQTFQWVSYYSANFSIITKYRFHYVCIYIKPKVILSLDWLLANSDGHKAKS